MSASLLEFRSTAVEIVRDRQPSVHPLQGVDLAVGRRQTVGLVGESGSGKSMTLRAALGLLPSGGRVTGGEVLWKGASLSAMTPRELERYRGSEVAMIFQDPISALNPVLSVERQICGAFLANRDGSVADARAAASAALTRLDIVDPERVLTSHPHQLSGGMAQRVNIAMAAVCRPSLMLADEPTTGLDVTTQLLVLDVLLESVREDEASLLFVSHDLRVIGRICDWIGVMYAGRVVEFGPRDQVLMEPCHPYTRALIACARIEPGGTPTFIPGVVPSLSERHTLCPYRERCPERVADCDEVPAPARSDPRSGRTVLCHVALGGTHE